MTIKPGYFGRKGSSGGDSELLADMPVNEVFVKNQSSELVGTGMRVLSDGSLLAPSNFGVESGSINFGDLITLSEASGFLALWDHLNQKQFQFVEYEVPRQEASHTPTFFKLQEGEWEFNATTDSSSVITTNPCSFNYTTQNTARTNTLVFHASQPMTNVRIKILAVDSNVVLKYLPSKSAWLGSSPGYNFVTGENSIDLEDSPVLLTAGTMLEFEIIANNVSLVGSASGIPQFDAVIQRGSFINVATALDVTPENIKYLLESLTSPDKLSKDSIQDAVLSVNGQFGDVVLDSESVGAQPESEVLTQLSGITLGSQILIGTDSSGNIELIPYTDFSKVLLGSEDAFTARGFLQLSSVASSGSYNDLTEKPIIPPGQIQSDWNQTNNTSLDFIKNKPTIPSAQLNSDWGAVSGVAQILNKPTLFSGSYTDLTNKPTLFDGTWTSLTGKPTFATVSTSGSYLDLSNKPTIPATTTNLPEGTNLYYTDSRVANYLSANRYKKVEMFQGTTNASGVYQVTFANTYTTVPHVNPVMINNAANYILTLTNVTTTGCTVTILQRSAVTLLAVEVLLAATVPVSGATVGVLVVSKD